MGSTIYYFSTTGNSLAAARKIAERLEDCKLVSMASQPPVGPVGGPEESIGFVFPVFYIGLPRIVRRFVEQLDIVVGTYCFAFITYGGNSGDTLGMLEDILKEKGVQLSYADGTVMPGNYIVKYQAYPHATVQKLLKTALGKAEEAAASIGDGKRKPVRRNFRLLSKILNQRYLYKNIPKWDEKFAVTDKCTGCGLCASICPVDNIKTEGRNPYWLHHCEHCIACIQWCPCEAIEFGKETVGRRRYRNPDISADDILKNFY